MSELDQLVNLLASANSPNTQQRDEATKKVLAFLKTDESLVKMMKIIEASSVDLNVRLLAAIQFKNHVKENWRDTDTTENPISRKDKDTIKQVIISLLITLPPLLQSMMMEALTVIGDAEFPNDWPTLLPELITKLHSNDYTVVNPVLQTLSSLFKRYKDTTPTNAVMLELKYILLIFPTPYLELLLKTGNVIRETKDLTGDQLKLLFTAILSMLEIFHSISNVDIAEFFEDNLGNFTKEFQFYLQYQSNCPQLVDSKSDEDPSLLNLIHTEICEILNLYTQRYDEVFLNYLQPFVTSVWSLLSQTSNAIKNDPLIFASLKFLSTVSMSIQHNLFQQEDTLKQICSCIVTPNIKLRESDLELYEDNAAEYMRRDIEGSDSDTRRRAAIELVKGLRKYFETQVTQLISVDINQLLQHYRANPQENWLSKDSAIFLVTALAIKTDSTAGVPVVEFFKAEVVPVLQNTKGVQPILVADCLKFITIFRQQLPAEIYPQLLQLCVLCLSNPDHVIHTYASTCIDRLLTVKDNGVPRLSAEFIRSVLGDILLPLVNVFSFPSSKQNERTMRAIVRIVLMMIGKVDVGTTTELLGKFTSILMAEIDNPSNHSFNHYCFEVIGSLLKSFAGQPNVFQTVIPLVNAVLQKDVQEFAPYTYQLLAILVENADAQYLAPYRSMIPILYTPAQWMRQANVPALVRLFQAFFKRDGTYIVQNNHLEPILGVYKVLVDSATNDHEGFYLLESIVENLEFAQYQKFVPLIFQVTFQRIARHKTDKLLRCFIVFLGVFINKIGIAETINIINSVRAGLWADVITKVWMVICGKVSGPIEKKIISVGMTHMLCSNEMFSTMPDSWVNIAQCQYQVLTNANTSNGIQSSEPSYIDAETPDGYVPTFTQLQFTKKEDTDPIPQIPDAAIFFREKFLPLYVANRQVFAPLMEKCQDLQRLLQ
ncbi:hypothetical protein SAMD00019534_013920 [Acytostelium subglobosum LB1]|uniref:hypothetical protein n=1 Tax=Acytostelium subglobosum LB1 TaxID=1410327 RepID=UPI000644F983|nr:hypothetical protein SAMD00019534_013920 [Acytostelium subglobosum LB1]GAM18217.1 hypothetical protein SAMD00019534_013920 [Acytostelium subglobosum LB1]|eukprot:XP_012758813.1 hypothetical protein SAMD00019534_013920 [Acytostelium subglobosum LB1]